MRGLELGEPAGILRDARQRAFSWLVTISGIGLMAQNGHLTLACFSEIGVLILSLLSNAVNMAGVSSFLQVLVVGVVIQLAAIDSAAREGRNDVKAHRP